MNIWNIWPSFWIQIRLIGIRNKSTWCPFFPPHGNQQATGASVSPTALSKAERWGTYTQTRFIFRRICALTHRLNHWRTFVTGSQLSVLILPTHRQHPVITRCAYWPANHLSRRLRAPAHQQVCETFDKNGSGLQIQSCVGRSPTAARPRPVPQPLSHGGDLLRSIT